MKPEIWNLESGKAGPKRRTVPLVLLAVIGAVALAGCSLLVGNKEAATIYAPDARIPADPAWPVVDWQLSVKRPHASRMLESLRIAVRPTPGELQVYKDASWAKPPASQVEDTVLHALEDSQKIPAVARAGSGIAGDYTLVMDVRRFEADYAGGALPTATIEVNAKLLHAPDQDVIGARTFLQAVPASGTDVALVSQAFEQALGQLGHDMAGWILVTGDAHQRSDAHAAKPLR